MRLTKKLFLLVIPVLMLCVLSQKATAQVQRDSGSIKTYDAVQDSSSHKKRRKKSKPAVDSTQYKSQVTGLNSNSSVKDSVSTKRRRKKHETAVDSTQNKNQVTGLNANSSVKDSVSTKKRRKKLTSTISDSSKNISVQQPVSEPPVVRKRKKSGELIEDSIPGHNEYTHEKTDTSSRKKNNFKKKKQLSTTQYDSIALAEIHKRWEEKKDTVVPRVLTPEDVASDIMNSGFLNLKGGHYDQAILYFNKVIVNYASTTQANPALFYRCKCYLGLKDTGLAITDISLFIDRDKCKSDLCREAYYLRANVYFNTRDYAHAINDFSKASTDTAFKNQKFCFFYKAICEGEIGQNIQAVQDFTKFLNMDNNKTVNSASALYYRGYYKVKLNDNRGAIKDYDNAIALYLAAIENSKGKENGYLSKLMDTYITRGLAKAEIKKFDEAIADYNSVLKLSPEYAVAYRLRGLSEIGKGDTDAGCLDLSKAGELGSTEAYDDIKLHCR